jgi:Conserved hypothetical protein
MTESKKNTRLYLDIEKVIDDKSPTLRKILPSFVVNYIKRLVHQDKLNQYMDIHKDKVGIDFIEGILGEMNTTLNLKGLENIPKTDRAVVVSNHPLGGLDGSGIL